MFSVENVISHQLNINTGGESREEYNQWWWWKKFYISINTCAFLCLITSNVDSTKWGVTECDSFHHSTTAPFHHSKYTFYQAVWVWLMLILLYAFGISTYVLT